MVMIPLGADQPLVAQQMSRLGVGPVLDLTNRTPETIRDAVRSVRPLREHRSNAERARDEMMALLEPAHAVTLFEKLVVEKMPVVTGTEE